MWVPGHVRIEGNGNADRLTTESRIKESVELNVLMGLKGECISTCNEKLVLQQKWYQEQKGKTLKVYM